MSELITTHGKSTSFQSRLMATVSALALTAYVASINAAHSEEADRPAVWVELGGQMERMQGLSSPFTAPFMTAITPTPGPYSGDIFGKGQKSPHFAFGLEGKLTFQPENSDWLFSASIRYGRSHTNRHIHQQSPTPPATFNGSVLPKTLALNAAAFADSNMPFREHHTIVDFSVGRDVGLGVFGHDGASQFGVGVRSVEMSSEEDLAIHGRPEIIIKRIGGGLPVGAFYNYTMWASAERSFRGTGPSLSWNASAGLLGSRENGELMLDWGINAAVLFGRQKAATDHKTHAYVFGTRPPKYNNYRSLYSHHTPSGSVRSRSVTVPNLGGTIGLSVKYPAAKVSLGYRADFFFGASDAGIDVRSTKDLGFYGPFATISIGLGG